MSFPSGSSSVPHNSKPEPEESVASAIPKVYLHDDGYFIYRFESEQDKASIMENGPYTYNNRPLILKTWTLEFQMTKEPICLIPLWVCFPSLPVLYWKEENLGRIASYLGKPICADRLTVHEDRVLYARVLIEMDVSQPLPEEMTIEKADGSLWMQMIEYEWRPTLCQKCL
uniref:DUF4283 domain-containing protein n=2 Tax=Nicotiana TaxID=4085 RepID=A0A1S4CMU7_TOBAC|nr:PREDICTED: uncharacterized protein LOC104215701 [Nicotiana sylvestris]XP_016502568.1 PREDICTED: uncharacterized protein LOC107820743 [Nicotiana tabacum]